MLRGVLIVLGVILICASAFTHYYAPMMENLEEIRAVVGVSILQFIAQDRWPMAMIGIILISGGVFKGQLPHLPMVNRPWTVPAIAAVAFVVVLCGRHWAHHGYDVSVDEYLSHFQARIFLEGHLMATLSEPYRGHDSAFQPLFVFVTESTYWASHYRPGFAILRALALEIGIEPALGAIFAGCSVLLIARIARQLFPGAPEAPVLAAALLAASPQFLVMPMSMFSFSGHLALNLLWLTLFLRADRTGHALAALVSVLAIGLHQVHVHPFFASTFLLLFLFGGFGPRIFLSYHVLAYVVAVPLWAMWPEIASVVETGEARFFPSSVWSINYIRNFAASESMWEQIATHSAAFLTMINSLRFVSWISLPLLVLVALACLKYWHLPVTARMALLGVVFTGIAYAILMPNQMHAWGWRYMHPMLGNCVIVAVAGYMAVRDKMGADLSRTVGALLVVSAVVLVPWRIWQVDEMVAPRAAAYEWMTSLDVDVVLVEPGIWFGLDYVRNDPYLGNRPLIMDATLATSPEAKALLEGRTTARVGQEELARFGIGVGTWLEYRAK